MEDNKHIKLRTVFMGTSPLAQVALQKLIEEQYNIVGVFTKADKKIGREQELTATPVKTLALENSIEVFQPIRFDEETVKTLRGLKPDLIVVAAYGKILPKTVLDMPGFGCINIHASLLPKFRGPSPIQNALLAGEKETGVTIMLMDENVDTGDILTQTILPIEEDDTFLELHDKLATLGAQLLSKTLPLWIKRQIESKPQNNSEATLCQLIEREDGRIFWETEAQKIYNRYRALFPWPGIFTFWRNEKTMLRLKLLKIRLDKENSTDKHAIGEVFQADNALAIQTIKGAILIEQLQLEGKKPMASNEFINGYPKFIGTILQ